MTDCIGFCNGCNCDECVDIERQNAIHNAAILRGDEHSQ